jgi:hypothetical protein
MDPLIEVSTDRGRNMRETCVRVLAATLMTAAIATVVGMSALFRSPGEARRPIAAPPSSLERTVRLMVRPAARHPRPAVRPARPVSAPVEHSAIAHTLVVIRTKPAPRPQRHLAAAHPPAPAPAPAAEPLPAPAPVAAPAPPAEDQPHEDDGRPGKGHGHAYGHDKREE